MGDNRYVTHIFAFRFHTNHPFLIESSYLYIPENSLTHLKDFTSSCSKKKTVFIDYLLTEKYDSEEGRLKNYVR